MSPDFRELGEEGTAEELERLRRVHELLVSVEPPPELGRRLARPARPRVLVRRPRVLARRPRVAAAAGLAAAAAIGLGFGLGYAVRGAGGGGSGFHAAFTRPMHGLGRAALATASIGIGKRDADGNWPLQMTVRGLPALPRVGWYELYLTRGGKPSASCGTFRTSGAVSVVRLTAPYDLREYDGWIVTAHVPGQPDRVLMTT